jgi:predicted DNA-binding antitoxin AbrB/MazE fold protein
MTLSIAATYENGVLKPEQPLPLKEHARVRVTIEAHEPERDRARIEAAVAAVRRTYGIIPWHADLETLDRLAMDPEFDPQERP